MFAVDEVVENAFKDAIVEHGVELIDQAESKINSIEWKNWYSGESECKRYWFAGRAYSDIWHISFKYYWRNW